MPTSAHRSRASRIWTSSSPACERRGCRSRPIEASPQPLPPGVDLSAYRIVQEALTNTLKHAGEAHARATLRYALDVLDIEVADDGRASPDADGGGQGLIGMRERVQLFGGTLESGPRPGGGFLVRARLPLPEETPT